MSAAEQQAPALRRARRQGERTRPPWRSNLQTPRTVLRPDRFEAGATAKRSVSVAGALLLFMAGFSIDDLHVLRGPAYLYGCIAAVIIMALGPLWFGRRFALAHRDEADEAYTVHAAQARRVGALTLLTVFILFLVWLVVFSAGVPPWAS